MVSAPVKADREERQDSSEAASASLEAELAHIPTGEAIQLPPPAHMPLHFLSVTGDRHSQNEKLHKWYLKKTDIIKETHQTQNKNGHLRNCKSNNNVYV